MLLYERYAVSLWGLCWEGKCCTSGMQSHYGYCVGSLPSYTLLGGSLLITETVLGDPPSCTSGIQSHYGDCAGRPPPSCMSGMQSHYGDCDGSVNVVSAVCSLIMGTVLGVSLVIHCWEDPS